jgi:hypothetical protein
MTFRSFDFAKKFLFLNKIKGREKLTVLK